MRANIATAHIVIANVTARGGKAAPNVSRMPKYVNSEIISWFALKYGVSE